MYSVLVLGEVCREHAFRTRYTYMYGVLVSRSDAKVRLMMMMQ